MNPTWRPSEFIAKDEAATARLAALFAQYLPLGTTIGLSGPLGAGKTRWVQAFAVAWGVPAGAVVSPTFVLCQEYAANRGRLFHLDVYRLEDSAAFLDLGAEEMFAEPGIVFIEWAERVSEYLPDDRIDVRIDLLDESTRRFTVVGRGAELAPALSAIEHAWSESA